MSYLFHFNPVSGAEPICLRILLSVLQSCHQHAQYLLDIIHLSQAEAMSTSKPNTNVTWPMNARTALTFDDRTVIPAEEARTPNCVFLVYAYRHLCSPHAMSRRSPNALSVHGLQLTKISPFVCLDYPFWLLASKISKSFRLC